MADQMLGSFGMSRMRTEPFGELAIPRKKELMIEMGGMMKQMDKMFEESHKAMERAFGDA